jgi:hypothetical protein
MHPCRQLFGYFYSTVQYEIGTTPHVWGYGSNSQRPKL